MEAVGGPAASVGAPTGAVGAPVASVGGQKSAVGGAVGSIGAQKCAIGAPMEVVGGSCTVFPVAAMRLRDRGLVFLLPLPYYRCYAPFKNMMARVGYKRIYVAA